MAHIPHGIPLGDSARHIPHRIFEILRFANMIECNRECQPISSIFCSPYIAENFRIQRLANRF